MTEDILLREHSTLALVASHDQSEKHLPHNAFKITSSDLLTRYLISFCFCLLWPRKIHRFPRCIYLIVGLYSVLSILGLYRIFIVTPPPPNFTVPSLPFYSETGPSADRFSPGILLEGPVFMYVPKHQLWAEVNRSGLLSTGAAVSLCREKGAPRCWTHPMATPARWWSTMLKSIWSWWSRFLVTCRGAFLSWKKLMPSIKVNDAFVIGYWCVNWFICVFCKWECNL